MFSTSSNSVAIEFDVVWSHPVITFAGAVVERILGREGGGAGIPRCVYIGDGSGDLHACLCLREGDVALARDGPGFALLGKLTASLARYIERGPSCVFTSSAVFLPVNGPTA